MQRDTSAKCEVKSAAEVKDVTLETLQGRVRSDTS